MANYFNMDVINMHKTFDKQAEKTMEKNTIKKGKSRQISEDFRYLVWTRQTGEGVAFGTGSCLIWDG